MSDEDFVYEDWSLDELHEEATNREIEGRSSMNKADLANALRADDNKAVPEPEPDEVQAPAPVPIDQPWKDTAEQAVVAEHGGEDEPFADYWSIEALARADAQTTTSDILRAHYNNIAGAVVGLRESLRQEAQWLRPPPAEQP